jgi:hypothetical protein
MLGFRQAVQQSTAPNGEAISVWTDYLLNEPYAGVARRAETRRGAWNNGSAQLLSSTVNTYCDSTSTIDPNMATETAPCTSSVKVRRPYLRKSIESGNDLAGTALPTVTTVNTYNNYGDPTQVSVTTSAVVAGASRDYIKTTVNEQCAPDTAGCPNKIAGDNWILGRLTRSTVSSTAPNLLSSLAANAGDAPNATATAGTLSTSGLTLSGCASTSPTSSPTPATMSCNLINLSALSIGSISYTTAPGTAVNGPAGFCSTGASCGTVTVTTNSGAGGYTGTLTATPNTGSAATQPINLTVLSPATLAFSNCASTTPTVTPTAASMTCTLSNVGQTGATSISYATAASTTVSGPTGACAAGATCGSVTVTTAASAATYSGTLTAAPNSGTAAAQSFSLVVQPPPQASFSPVSGTSLTASSPSPQCREPRTYSYAVVNVTNVGGGSLSILGSSSSWVIGLTYTCTSASPGQTCTVRMRRSGSGSATVTINTNGGSASYPVGGFYGASPPVNCIPNFAPPPTE